jgi:CRP-like cAMP-binding protein
MSLEQDIEFLGMQPILAPLPREALRLLAFSAEMRVLRAGDVLFRTGDKADAAYIVVTGTVALNPRDDGSPAAHTVGMGHLIGEIALFAPVERPATAIARETMTVMRITRSVMARVLAEFPEAAARIHALLAQRLDQLSTELAGVRRDLGAIGA